LESSEKSSTTFWSGRTKVSTLPQNESLEDTSAKEKAQWSEIERAMKRASDTHAIGIARSSQSPELCFEMSVALGVEKN
jgi:hypothetical protein